MIEDQIIRTLETLKENHFTNDLLLIYYNLKKEDPMEFGDEGSLFAYINQLRLKRITGIFYGSGGNLFSGGAIGQFLQDRFDYYDCFVPFSCCSSMCYPLLYAKKLTLTSMSNITQIDPIIKVGNENIRIIRILKDKDPEVSSNAKIIFNKVRDLIPTILAKKNSLYNNKINTHLTKNEEVENIVDLFMNKQDHAAKITYGELKQLNLNVNMVKDEMDLIKGCRSLVNKCQEFLEKENKRMLILCTQTLKNYKERILVSET